jgi:hypothetical protein
MMMPYEISCRPKDSMTLYNAVPKQIPLNHHALTKSPKREKEENPGLADSTCLCYPS